MSTTITTDTNNTDISTRTNSRRIARIAVAGLLALGIGSASTAFTAAPAAAAAKVASAECRPFHDVTLPSQTTSWTYTIVATRYATYSPIGAMQWSGWSYGEWYASKANTHFKYEVGKTSAQWVRTGATFSTPPSNGAVQAWAWTVVNGSGSWTYLGQC